MIHDTNKIGLYWERIPNYEQRSRCQKCDGITESLEHIMTECEASGQKIIWKLAAETLASRNVDILNLSIGDIMGSTMAQFKGTDGKPNTALNRLYTIIMTESMYLIWLLRCEWVLDHGGNPEKIMQDTQVTIRWQYRVNRRIRLDQTMATKKAHKWKKVDKKAGSRYLERHLGTRGRPPRRLDQNARGF